MKSKTNRIDPLLIVISLLAAFLNIYGIWKDQYSNAYYTAAVTSMLQSFQNFFFASFDPGGFVTVDKPPVAFWVQTLFASILGVHGWSVILPQALAGVGSVLLIYILVKPTYGRTAARISALIMACTPVAAAISRSNNVDSLLVFTLLLATWMLFKAVNKSQAFWFICAFALIGVAFNIKMLQAYMVLPAFYVFYWLAYKTNWQRKLSVLAASTAVMLILSFSWAVIVDSIPHSQRPYIGSSQTNSVLELAFGYNGLARLTGLGGSDGGNHGTLGNGQTNNLRQFDGGQNLNSGQDRRSKQMLNNGNFSGGLIDDGGQRGGPMGDGGQRGAPGGGGMFNTGTPGPLRLFQSSLSGQISWMLLFALFSALGLLIGIRRKQPLTDKQKESLFWLAWLLPMMVFFSIAGFFHQYYLVMLAPAIAVLAGTGWIELNALNRQSEGWKRWLLPIATLVTTMFQLYILLPYQSQIGWALPVVVGALGLMMTLCFAVKSFSTNQLPTKVNSAVATCGILILLAAPFFWAMTPLLYGDTGNPAAGPQQIGNRAAMPGMQDRSQGQIQGHDQDQDNLNTKLIAYLEAHNTGEKFLFATSNARTAEAYIIQTGKAVMAMGGFSGSDPILTVDKLKEIAANHEVKYFLLSGGGQGEGSSDVQAWIQQNGTEIPQSEWQSGSSQNTQNGMGMNGAGILYEVKS